MLYDITNIDHSKKRIEVELPHRTLKVPAILTADDSRTYIEAELPTGIVKEKSKLSVELPFAANGNNEYPIKVYADGDDINPDTYTLAFKKFKNTLELSEITVNGRKAKRDPDNVRKFYDRCDVR